MKPKDLMSLAEEAREASYSPYSKFAVGAALLTKSGRVVLGCNVENSSFGLACCAERTAIFKAVSEGEREFLAIAVTAGKGHGAAPCGACRQVLHEFSPEMWVYFHDDDGAIVRKRVNALLSNGFRLRSRGGKK
ncbi:MAG: cytidine deaminase [Candidatus Eisenbacteria bacterium]|uniref:Cytidine deaminase n=1 Tax=Eiseniibacteriota bacterium TaxID=2212470 RepID=A0A933W8C0_UNCEI|nr:cytidine deaminase [Candidatus Eisenbacteria bacterium]